MNTSTLLVFLPACFALNMAPGPNNLLSVSNAARYGFWPAWAGGIGRLFAFAGMIALTAIGLAFVLQASEWVFDIIKTIGAAYLLYLAVQLWRAPGNLAQQTQGFVRKPLALVRQEFFVAIGNPKAIVIFTAFLPQFVDPVRATGPQFLFLGSVFLALECVAISLYACMGLNMRRFFQRPGAMRIFNRSCAALLGFAGLGLLLSRRTASGA